MEINDNLKVPKTIREGGSIQTSVLVSVEFWKLCKQYNIKLSEALRKGISLELAEKGLAEYDNNLNLMRRIRNLTQQLENTSQKYYELLEQSSVTKE